MKGSKTQKTVGKSKPSQASLVSRGLAVKPSLTRSVDGRTSGPPSVQSGYSLYSSDSESTNVEVNQGLNRCAKLLANILDTNDHGHPIKTGLATYRHQGQKFKTSAKPRRGPPSKPDPKPLKTGQRSHAPERKSARAPQRKTHHSRTLKRKDTVTSTMSVPLEAHQGRCELSESKRSVSESSTVHIIPTGSDDLEDKPVAGPYRAQSVMRNTRHLAAPGLQDHLMSSTPAERESPKKPQGHTATPKQTPKPPSPSRQGPPRPATLAKLQSGQANRSVVSRRGHSDSGLSDELPEVPANLPGELNPPVVGRPGVVGDVAAGSTQGPEPDRDWMRWYDESVAKQAVYEPSARGPKSPSPRQPQSANDGASAEPERDISGWAVSARHPLKRPATPPLKESEDLLRELVQQLTILNQSDKVTAPLGKTEEILQGLIQNRQPVPPQDPSDTGPDTGPLPYTGPQYCNSSRSEGGQPSLGQLLSEFRQTPSRPTPSGIGGALPFNVGAAFNHRRPTEMTDLEPTKDTAKSQAEIPAMSPSPPQEAFCTPTKAPRSDHVEDSSDHVPTPFGHQLGYNIPAPEQGQYIQVGKPAPQVPTSPPPSTEPLTIDRRGHALRQSCLQQIKTLKYLLGELQAVLSNHEDIDVSRLLNELEEVCNTLPYTTQKQLLDLNTEVLLALQPLQSENGQLRQRLRVANQQLQSRERAEKRDEGSVSLEAMTLQALNSNLQKQLRQERQEKEQLVKNNLEMSKSLEEREHQHQDMLRILSDKDSNLLKTRQETLAELQDLREARSELRSKLEYLELQVEGANKEARIRHLSLAQRDNEIARLKSLNRNLQEEVSQLRSQHRDDCSSAKTFGGVGLQRKSHLLTERLVSPNRANKENIQSPPNCTPGKPLKPAKSSFDPFVSRPASPNHARETGSALAKKSPKQRVTFLDTSEWARTDTLWKDQQEQPGDLISLETEGIQPERDTVGGPVSASPDRLEFPPKRGTTTPMLISDSVQQDTANAREDRFGDKLMFGNRISPYHSDLDIPKPADFCPALREASTHTNSQRATWGDASKPTIASAVSDSTVSSITTEYEAQFQSGLRDLDAEIGKLQASLKYGAFIKPF